METATKKEVGNLIAHWRREPTEQDIAVVDRIIHEAVRENGIKCSISIDTYRHTPSLGFGGIRAIITLNNPVNGHRDQNGTLYKGLSIITIDFDRCAGLYSFEEHTRRHEEEARLAESLGGYEQARAAIDALPWDAECLQYSARTNGLERGYRRRTWWRCEGKDHFGYDSNYKGLGEQVKAYIGNLASMVGIYNPTIVYPPKAMNEVA